VSDLTDYYRTLNRKKSDSSHPEKPERQRWDSYFLTIASAVATRATCDRAHVGVVFTRDNRILVTGYNGSVSGSLHCDEVGHLMIDGHCKRTVHAEANAICDAARRGIDLNDSDVYLTHTPCFECAKLLVSVGVKRVVCKSSYRVNDASLEMLSSNGIRYISDTAQK